ncbi:SURF1 family protein [Nocardia sp. NPDC088792]|uniref:SURF1 family cytochrome oxidase biogenesis protein n=1 Tax=Nocardia sp. NPDC088792 TaxID=3364332 RepID=UPI003816A699
MRRFTFLLRPGWVILALVVAAFAYLCFSVLAPWQLGKNTTTSARNQRIEDSVTAAPVDVTTMLSGSGKNTEWRRVTADGTYVPGTTVLVRLRHLNDQPAYGVLNAFRLTDGRTLLVDRGLVSSPDGGTRLPQIAEPPAGAQHLEARVRASEGVIANKPPMTESGYRQVYTNDTEQMSTLLGIPLTPIPTDGRGGYLQLAENQPGAFTPTPLPQLDSGPYLSYGLQWLAFGIMAPLGLGYFVFAEIRARRRERAETAEQPQPQPVSTGPGPSPATVAESVDTESEPAAPKVVTNEARLADRYGGTRR